MDRSWIYDSALYSCVLQCSCVLQFVESDVPVYMKLFLCTPSCKTLYSCVLQFVESELSILHVCCKLQFPEFMYLYIYSKIFVFAWHMNVSWNDHNLSLNVFMGFMTPTWCHGNCKSVTKCIWKWHICCNNLNPHMNFTYAATVWTHTIFKSKKRIFISNITCPRPKRPIFHHNRFSSTCSSTLHGLQ
jgi:hypothetical protein